MAQDYLELECHHAGVTERTILGDISETRQAELLAMITEHIARVNHDMPAARLKQVVQENLDHYAAELEVQRPQRDISR